MRIAVVTPLPDSRDAGLYIAASRLLRGISIFVPSQPEAQLWPQDVRPVPLPAINKGLTRQWLRGLRSAIADFGPELIHVHNEPWAVTSQRLLRGNRPVVIHGAESILAEAPLRYRLRRIGTRTALQRAAGYVNWGVTGLRAAEGAGLPASTPRAVISASPPDPAVFTRAPAPEPGRRLHLTFVGRLVPEKGVQTILQAMAAPHRREAVSLTVVGGGPVAQELQDSAKALGVDARFAGPMDAAGTHSQIAAGDVLVVPSIDIPRWSEQWGRVVAEAMMTGRSVLASDAGELPYLVGQPDWIFRQDDPESLGRAVDVLLADPKLASTRAEVAFQRAQLFQPEVLAVQLIDFWGEVLANWRDRISRR